MRIAALLLAAGTGRRFGGAVPPPFHRLGGRVLVRHAAEALLPHVSLLQPVGDPSLLDQALHGLDTGDAVLCRPVPGGATRRHSVRAGLEALDALPSAERPDLVLVHDGTRPWVPADLVRRVLAALDRHDGAVPCIPVTDTLKRCRDGMIAGSVMPAELVRAQTPQGFRFALLRDLHRAAGDGVSELDDAALLERAGHAVPLVPGSEDNIALTVAEDLVRLERLMAPPLLPRTGTGFDVHAFAPDRPLVLCGVTVPHPLGLLGHSDADVGHPRAVRRDLRCAGGGRHRPALPAPARTPGRTPTAPRFLVHAGERIAARGGVLANADVTLICERPKIGPYAAAMRERLAALLRVGVDRVSVKATTTERLGFAGRGEGIAAQASATVLVP